MAKDRLHWFKFYPADWLLGANDLTLEERGMYINLLAIQWREGGVPDSMEKISQILRTDPRVVRRICPKLLAEKFEKCSKLLQDFSETSPRDSQEVSQSFPEVWINARLEEERQATVVRSSTRSISGRKGAKVRWQNDSIKKKNKSRSRIEVDKEFREIEKDGPNPQDIEVVDKMAEAVRKRGSTGFPNFEANKSLRERWLDEARLLRERDGRDPKTTLELISGLSRGDFQGTGDFNWADQIKHPGKFRKKNKAGETYWEVLCNERTKKNRPSGRNYEPAGGPSKFDILRKKAGG